MNQKIHVDTLTVDTIRESRMKWAIASITTHTTNRKSLQAEEQAHAVLAMSRQGVDDEQ